MYRRGLSTVVGAVFFGIAMTTVITYVSYSLNIIDDFAQSSIIAESLNVDRGNEEIKISTVSIDGGKFNATIVNTGSLPVHLTRLWATNEDTSSPMAEKGNLDVIINPGYQKYNIGQSLGITADPTTSYTIKAVTERGNVATYSISTDTSTRIIVMAPGSLLTNEKFWVTEMILNNSTKPHSIADLTPIMDNDGSLTPLFGPDPTMVKSLPDGDFAVFRWQYQAPGFEQIIIFNGSYNGAPTGSFNNVTVDIKSVEESESASSSQWADKARKVGILISGVPSPIDSSNQAGAAKFGIGILNPLDRNVEVYAVAVNAVSESIFKADPTGVEPATGGVWGNQFSGGSIIYWEANTDPPFLIPPESIGQFRMIGDVSGSKVLYESGLVVEALTSEGKINALYNISTDNIFPTVNIFYTNSTADPVGSNNQNWGYIVNGVKGGTWKIYNATVENTSDNLLGTKVAINVLIPKDFTNVKKYSNSDFDDPAITTNPDGSTFLKANSTANLGADSGNGVSPYHITFQFNATAPTVTEDSLYVFQTVVYYPGWTVGPEIASSISEVGIEIIP